MPFSAAGEAAGTEFVDLDAVLDDAWERLGRGAEQRDHPYRLGVLGTCDTSGSGCELRTVVLRRCDPQHRELIFHTDARSPKLGWIAHNPRISWLFYDPEAKLQLRLQGHAAVHRGDRVADQAWAATPLRSRRSYATEAPPGTPLDGPASGLPASFQAHDATAADSHDFSDCFAVVVTTIRDIDWLYLSSRGHRRAQFGWAAGGWTGRWVVP